MKLTKKGNLKIKGVKYRAVPETLHAGCKGCAFDGPGVHEACGVGRCTQASREELGLGSIPVIFVREEPKL